MRPLIVNVAVAVLVLVTLLVIGHIRNAYFGVAENFCPAGERPVICPQIYAPVCGWFDPARIQCIRYPCAATYPNSCIACADEKVLNWTGGPCPK